jgi:hypothetical protein
MENDQIEAEGWQIEKWYFKKKGTYLFYEFKDKYLEIDAGNPFTGDACDSYVIYRGVCKDIKTFRKIIKLLEIK